MSYKLPSVSVFQILLRASQDLAESELLPCFIGSLNQVVKDSSISLSYPVSSATVVYPNLKIGAIVDSSSVSISVKNAVIKVDTTAVATTLVAGSYTISGATGKFLSAKAGDKIVFDTASYGKYTIASIDSTGTTATVVEKINYPAASTTPFSIQRSVGTVTAVIGGATYSSTSLSFTSLKYSTYDIISGDAYISYVALRKDLTGFYEVTNQDTLRADLDVDYANPLGYYLGVVAPSANGGRKTLAYIIADESDESYIASLSDLATRKDAYLLVPLSTSSVVKNAFAAHAITMSQPESSYFRSALLNSTLITQETVSSSVTYTKA